MNTIKTVLHYYRFNIENAEELAAWEELCEKLRGMGLRVFDSISSEHSRFYRDHIRPLNGQPVDLETKHLFDNQWNTAPTATSESGLRVFDWAEAIYPNRSIKEGQWLEQTDEMRAIRDNTLKCGYCGAQHAKASGKVFCDSCLDSSYLAEKDLPLLRLLPVSADGPRANRGELSDDERAELMPLYVERQTKGKASRAVQAREKKRADVIASYEKTELCARMERDGLLWLLDRHISTDNVIFYNHTKTFSFGWRSPLSADVRAELEKQLKDFPFPVEFKEAGK